jgi:hypothetical protein
MSTVTQQTGPRKKRVATVIQMKQVAAETSKSETLELIRDITAAKGLLDEELLRRLKGNKLFEVLDKNVQQSIEQIVAGGPKGLLKTTMINIVDAYREKPLPPTVGWSGMYQASTRLLDSEKNGNAGSKKHTKRNETHRKPAGRR